MHIITRVSVWEILLLAVIVIGVLAILHAGLSDGKKSGDSGKSKPNNSKKSSSAPGVNININSGDSSKSDE